MKKLSRFKLALPVGFLLLSSAMGHAHLPFVAPQAYIVDGNSTSVIGGFAEVPFASEIALKGFGIEVENPAGKKQPLELKENKSLTIADVETQFKGTYKIIANRENKVDYALVNDHWMRVLNSESEQLAPLAERNFITPKEITDKIKTVNTVRHEQLLSYFSKGELSDLVLKPSQKGLELQFSKHPNRLTAKQPVTLTVTQDGKVQSGFEVVLAKNVLTLGEKELEIKSKTDHKGQVQMTFPQAGQYMIEVDTPASAEKAQPMAQSYRLRIAVQVN